MREAFPGVYLYNKKDKSLWLYLTTNGETHFLAVSEQNKVHRIGNDDNNLFILRDEYDKIITNHVDREITPDAKYRKYTDLTDKDRKEYLLKKLEKDVWKFLDSLDDAKFQCYKFDRIKYPNISIYKFHTSGLPHKEFLEGIKRFTNCNWEILGGELLFFVHNNKLYLIKDSLCYKVTKNQIVDELSGLFDWCCTE